MSYLEWQGNLFFADWQGPEEMKKRVKNNYYDQQLNESRLKSKNGSAIREGFLTNSKLLNKSIKDLVEGFNVGASTIYYYLSQLKKAGYIEEGVDGFKVIKQVFDEEEIMENLFVRGSHQLIPHWRIIRYNSGEPIKLKSCGESLKGCKFYDELEQCENMCERVKLEVGKGYLVVISPYSRGSFKSLDESFRKKFRNWFAKRQERMRTV